MEERELDWPLSAPMVWDLLAIVINGRDWEKEVKTDLFITRKVISRSWITSPTTGRSRLRDKSHATTSLNNLAYLRECMFTCLGTEETQYNLTGTGWFLLICPLPRWTESPCTCCSTYCWWEMAGIPWNLSRCTQLGPDTTVITIYIYISLYFFDSDQIYVGFIERLPQFVTSAPKG